MRALLRELSTDDVAEGAQLTRVVGGSSNRIIGVTLSAPSGDQLVLRIPRWDDSSDIDVAKQVAVLRARVAVHRLCTSRTFRFDARTQMP